MLTLARVLRSALYVFPEALHFSREFADVTSPGYLQPCLDSPGQEAPQQSKATIAPSPDLWKLGKGLLEDRRYYCTEVHVSHGSTKLWEGYLGWKDSPLNSPPLLCSPAMTWTNVHQGTGGIPLYSP